MNNEWVLSQCKNLAVGCGLNHRDSSAVAEQCLDDYKKSRFKPKDIFLNAEKLAKAKIKSLKKAAR